MFYRLFFFGLLFCCISCSEEKTFEDFDINDLQIYFRTYVQSFIEDAQERNQNLDNLDNIDIFFVTDLPLDILAQCTGDQDNGTIQIELQYWIDADYPERKRIIYHELGHCLLGRNHRDDVFSNGHCVSIMENSDCKGQSGAYFFCDDYMDYYLGELFSQVQTTTNWVSDTLTPCYTPVEHGLNFTLNNQTGSIIPETRLRLKEIDRDPFIFQNFIDPFLGKNPYSYNIGDLFFDGESALLEIEYDGKVIEKNFIYSGTSVELGDIVLD